MLLSASILDGSSCITRSRFRSGLHSRRGAQSALLWQPPIRERESVARGLRSRRDSGGRQRRLGARSVQCALRTAARCARRRRRCPQRRRGIEARARRLHHVPEYASLVRVYSVSALPETLFLFSLRHTMSTHATVPLTYLGSTCTKLFWYSVMMSPNDDKIQKQKKALKIKWKIITKY